MSAPFLAVVLVCVLLAAGAAELHSLRCWNRRVTLECELDMRLTEPGEAATLTYRLSNTASWPMSAVSVSFLFDSAVRLLEDGAQTDPSDLYSVDTALMPRRSCRGSVRLCFTQRGSYDLGRAYVETGDFLGFRSVIRAFDIPIHVVCTAAPAENRTRIRPLGGFLGDVSVRRFIFEDPGLVAGYRDYTGAEPMKSVSWLQTARTGRLMVKQHDYTTDVDVAILVDVEAVKTSLVEQCLSLVRTVCDELERQRIPYVVLSNGDLQSRQKGVGRVHCFEVQRMIGTCRFFSRLGFPSFLAGCTLQGTHRGYIIVAPRRSAELEDGVRRLRAATGTQVCVLTGKEDEEYA